MPWWCLGCGRQRGGPVCRKGCKDHGAERIPPLDGWITLEPEGYTKTPADELADRERWFEDKRRKEVKQMKQSSIDD